MAFWCIWNWYKSKSPSGIRLIHHLWAIASDRFWLYANFTSHLFTLIYEWSQEIPQQYQERFAEWNQRAIIVGYAEVHNSATDCLRLDLPGFGVLRHNLVNLLGWYGRKTLCHPLVFVPISDLETEIGLESVINNVRIHPPTIFQYNKIRGVILPLIFELISWHIKSWLNLYPDSIAFGQQYRLSNHLSPSCNFHSKCVPMLAASNCVKLIF